MRKRAREKCVVRARASKCVCAGARATARSAVPAGRNVSSKTADREKTPDGTGGKNPDCAPGTDGPGGILASNVTGECRRTRWCRNSDAARPDRPDFGRFRRPLLAVTLLLVTYIIPDADGGSRSSDRSSRSSWGSSYRKCPHSVRPATSACPRTSPARFVHVCLCARTLASPWPARPPLGWRWLCAGGPTEGAWAGAGREGDRRKQSESESERSSSVVQ